MALLAAGLVGRGDVAKADYSAAFCTNVVFHSKNEYCSGLNHDGIAGYMTAVMGSGKQHSVCVESRPTKNGITMCSPGPNQPVYNDTMTGILAYPWIQNNANGENQVYGYAYFNDWPKSYPAPVKYFWHKDNLGGTFTADLDISSWGPNRLDIFGRGLEGSLWHRAWSNSWFPWEFLGGGIVGGPGAVSWGSGRIDVVERVGSPEASTHEINHRYFINGVWSSDSLGGAMTSDPDISSWGPGRLDVFARGATGHLMHKYYTGGSWSGWEDMGGNIAGGPSAVSWSTNRIDVVARNAADSSIDHWYWNGAGWFKDNLGGTITADPDISSWGSERLDVFGRGTEGGLWHKFWIGGQGWYPWESLGGSITGGPAAVSSEPNRIDVVARNAGDNSVDHWYWSP